jgi:hypothetical protein
MTRDELIARILARKQKVDVPKFEPAREHPMVEIQRQIRAKKFCEFYNTMKRRP